MHYIERVDVGDGWEELIDELNDQLLGQCPWVVREPRGQIAASAEPKEHSLSQGLSYLLFDNVSGTLMYENFYEAWNVRMILYKC